MSTTVGVGATMFVFVLVWVIFISIFQVQRGATIFFVLPMGGVMFFG